MPPREMVLAVVLGVAAVAGPGPAALAAEPAVVKVGVLGLVSDAGLYVAMERGFFQEAGLSVDVERFGSGAKMVPALVAGELEVAGGTAAAGLFNAIASGMDFKVVADKGQTRPGHEFLTLIVRKDLQDSGAVRSLADLRGRKVAHLPGQGVVSQYLLAQILAHAGIPWSGVERVDIAAPNQMALLSSRQVDAAVAGEPFAAQAERAGVARRYAVGSEVKALERLQVAVFMYSGKFIAGRRDVARRWMAAYVKGLQVVQEKGLKSDEVIGIMLKHVRVTAEDLRAAAPPFLAPDGRPDLASLAAQQEWYAQMGMVQRRVPMEKVVDLSFRP